MKIALGIPSNRGVKLKTVKSLLELIVDNKYNFCIITAEMGYHIAENRNYIATQAVKNNCDYLFFTDDDMIFPPDTLERLLEHRKEIVGVAYHPRFETKEGTVRLDETHILSLDKPGAPTELFECQGVGTGVLLIDTSVFRKIARPWFYIQSHEVGKVTMGEDWWFCKQAMEAGYKIWCDPTLTIGHIGEFTF